MVGGDIIFVGIMMSIIKLKTPNSTKSTIRSFTKRFLCRENIFVIFNSINIKISFIFFILRYSLSLTINLLICSMVINFTCEFNRYSSYPSYGMRTTSSIAKPLTPLSCRTLQAFP